MSRTQARHGHQKHRVNTCPQVTAAFEGSGRRYDIRRPVSLVLKGLQVLGRPAHFAGGEEVADEVIAAPFRACRAR